MLINSYRFASATTYDTDAQAYITAVETADGASLETATRDAINAFVVGCKADGIWPAIKASCILAGARTLAGALVPLVGTAPTPVAFLEADYNRKTGLAGDGSSKYLNSNRANNADPLDNIHIATFVTSQNTKVDGGYYGMLGSDHEDFAVSHQYYNLGNFFRMRSASHPLSGNASSANFLVGARRSSSTSVITRFNKVSFGLTRSSSTSSQIVNYSIFRGSAEARRNWYANSRQAFYSIGESLDLAQLDTRVTALITAFSTAF